MRFFILLFQLLLMSAGGQAAVGVRAQAAKSEILLAEPFEIVYTLELPEGQEADFSKWKPGTTQWENFTLWDFKVKKAGNETELKVQLIPFKLGEVHVPSLEIPVKGSVASAQQMAGESSKALETPAIPIKVLDPTSGAPDANKIKDIKSPRKPLYFWESPLGIAVLSLAFLAILAGTILGWLSLRKKAGASAFESEEEKLAPEEAFLRGLANLEQSGTLEARRYREFNFALSEIFRRYLDRRFDLETEAQTTYELLRTLHARRQEFGISPSPLAALKENMEIMDLVKFAKYEPSAGEQFQAIQTLKDFVEAHRPVAVTEEEQKLQAAS